MICRGLSRGRRIVKVALRTQTIEHGSTSHLPRPAFCDWFAASARKILGSAHIRDILALLRFIEESDN